VDETYGRLARSVGGEVGFVMVPTSPRVSLAPEWPTHRG
jgi:hypothetical protein